MNESSEKREVTTGNGTNEEVVIDVQEVEETEHIEPKEEKIEENDMPEVCRDMPRKVHSAIEELIEEARSLVNISDSETKQCRFILDDDIGNFEEAKSKIFRDSINETIALLDEVGFEHNELKDIGEEAVRFGTDSHVDPMWVNDLSSGKFKSFMLALLAGFITSLIWIYIASKQLGLTLDIGKILSTETQESILTWLGGGITGGAGSVTAGIVFMLASALIVMTTVYMVCLQYRAEKNLKEAKYINEKAKIYCVKKEECKHEMEKIGDHLNQVIAAINTYKIYFDEQNAKLRRILYLEGYVPFDEFHEKSKGEMSEIDALVQSFAQLISTPMAGDNGTLCDDAKFVLGKSQIELKKFREMLYQ